MSLPTIYRSSPLCYTPILDPDITISTLFSVSPQYKVLHPCVTFHFWQQISHSAPYYQSPHNIQFFTLLFPSPFGPRYQISSPYYQYPYNIQFYTAMLPYNFGPKFHSQHTVTSLPAIYSSTPLCYLPHLAPDINLSTLLSVSPQYTVLFHSVTFPFWPQISLSAHYYYSPHNIQFFTPLLPSHFGPRYHSQHPIISLPTIYISSPLCYLPHLDPDITLSTLLSVSPQYTVLHPSVTFPLWYQISLSAPYYQSHHIIQLFTPRLPSTTGLRYHSQHPFISLPTKYIPSPLCYLPILAPNITVCTLLSVSTVYKNFFTPLLPSNFDPKYHTQHPIIRLPTIYIYSSQCYLPLLDTDITLTTLLSVSP